MIRTKKGEWIRAEDERVYDLSDTIKSVDALDVPIEFNNRDEIRKNLENTNN
jgi:hypothetical protein